MIMEGLTEGLTTTDIFELTRDAVLDIQSDIQSEENWQPENTIRNGVDAMEVLFGYAEQYGYSDLLRMFEEDEDLYYEFLDWTHECKVFA